MSLSPWKKAERNGQVARAQQKTLSGRHEAGHAADARPAPRFSPEKALFSLKRTFPQQNIPPAAQGRPTAQDGFRLSPLLSRHRLMRTWPQQAAKIAPACSAPFRKRCAGRPFARRLPHTLETPQKKARYPLNAVKQKSGRNLFAKARTFLPHTFRVASPGGFEPPLTA